MKFYLILIFLAFQSISTSDQFPSFLQQTTTYSICSDYQQLTSYETLLWPVKDKPIPWEIFPTAKVYHSLCFRDKFNAFFSRIIPGSNNITFAYFLNTLISKNCIYYPHGGFIRDLINSMYPHDLDGQYSCTKEELQDICDDLFGVGFSYVDMNTSYFFIGNHSLEGFSWNSSFFTLEDQEYTPDSLYYDPLNEVLLDLSGKGFEDVKKSQIRIPVEKNKWDRWLIKSNDTAFLRMFALRKVPRYWKLKEIGFRDYDVATISYLKRKIVNLWDNSRFSMKTAFMMHLCWILDGKYVEELDKACVPREEIFQEQNIQKCKKFVSVIMEDFYQMPGRILKDLQYAVKDTGCYIEKNCEWGKVVFILLIAFLMTF